MATNLAEPGAIGAFGPGRKSQCSHDCFRDSCEVLSNVVDGKSPHPAISGCFFYLTVDELNPFDDLRDELREVGASVSRRRWPV